MMSYKKINFLLLLCIYALSHSADDGNEKSWSAKYTFTKEELEQFLKERNGGVKPEPTPPKFVASCKTKEGTYLVVYSNGGAPTVKISSDLSVPFQEVHKVEGSVFHSWEKGTGYIVISAWLEMVKGVVKVKQEDHLVTEAKHLLLVGFENKVEQGILDTKKWELQDVLEKNQNIPGGAWLDFINTAPVDHPLQKEGRTVYIKQWK